MNPSPFNKNEELLAYQEKRLVLDYWTALISSPNSLVLMLREAVRL